MLQTLPFLYQDDDQMVRVQRQLSGRSNVTNKSPSGGNTERNQQGDHKMTFEKWK